MMTDVAQRRGQRRGSLVAALVGIALVVASCDGAGTTDRSRTTPPGTSSPAAAVPREEAGSLGGTSNLAPIAGTSLSVIGVAPTNRLNLRAGPSLDAEVLRGIAVDDDVVSRGRSRVTDGTWYDVEVDGIAGWADADLLAVVGAATDITAGVQAMFDRPVAATSMGHLGQLIVDERIASQPPVRASVVVRLWPNPRAGPGWSACGQPPSMAWSAEAESTGR